MSIKISCNNFMALTEDFSWELPSEGQVLIVGPNGVGKSNRFELISHALYNKSLRHPTNKPSGWRVDEKGWCEVELPDLKVRRTVDAKGRTKLESSLEESYPTTTKHQEAIESIIGKFETWKHSCYITSGPLGKFSLQTDKQRKELIENILGLHELSKGLKQVRSDLSVVRSDLQMAKYKAKSEAEKLAMVRCEANHAKQEKPEDVDLDALREEIKELRASKTVIEASIREIDNEKSNINALIYKNSQGKSKVEEMLLEHKTGQCSRCGGKPKLQYSVEELNKFLVRYDAKDQEYKSKLQNLPNVTQLSSDLANNAQNISKATAKGMDYKRQLEAYEKSEKVLEDIKRREKDYEESVELAKKQSEDLEEEYSILEVCDKLMGPKGIRARILQDAIHTLNTYLKVYCRKLCPPGVLAKVDLVKDAITLEVEGYSKMKDYISLSNGQRARVDIAISMSLSRMAAMSANSKMPRMLLLDECLDGLDTEGIEAVQSLLTELSQDMPVVIISHNKEFISTFTGEVISL